MPVLKGSLFAETWPGKNITLQYCETPPASCYLYHPSLSPLVGYSNPPAVVFFRLGSFLTTLNRPGLPAAFKPLASQATRRVSPACGSLRVTGRTGGGWLCPSVCPSVRPVPPPQLSQPRGAAGGRRGPRSPRERQQQGARRRGAGRPLGGKPPAPPHASPVRGRGAGGKRCGAIVAALPHRRISLLSEPGSFSSRWIHTHLLGFREPVLLRCLLPWRCTPARGPTEPPFPCRLCFTGHHRGHHHPVSAPPRIRETSFTPQALRQSFYTLSSSLGHTPELRARPSNDPPSFSPLIPHSTVFVNTFSLHSFLNSCTALK